MTTIEQQLAYSAARSDIEMCCMPDDTSVDLHEYWWDIIVGDVEDDETVTRAIEYLESRNLLEWHPDRPDLIRIKPEQKE